MRPSHTKFPINVDSWKYLLISCNLCFEISNNIGDITCGRAVWTSIIILSVKDFLHTFDLSRSFQLIDQRFLLEDTLIDDFEGNESCSFLKDERSTSNDERLDLFDMCCIRRETSRDESSNISMMTSIGNEENWMGFRLEEYLRRDLSLHFYPYEYLQEWSQ